MSYADPMVLRKSLESITRDLGRAYKFMPNTSQGANSETGKRLHAGETTFSDEESFLPVKLRSKAYHARLCPSGSAGGLPPATTAP
jgi:hypothetical protein